MKSSHKFGPLYIFIGISFGFAFLLAFFQCLGTEEKKLGMLVLLHSLILSGIGILLLHAEGKKHKLKS